MTAASLIQVPYHLGRESGSGLGVPVLAAALGGGGTVVERAGAYRNEPAACFDVVRALVPQVRAAAASGALPVVLAGNCHSSLGTVAALDGDVGVVWLDAHADFNTPETTESGFFDGMGLALLTGEGWDALRSGIPGHRPVAPENVVLCARDLDHAEWERLTSSTIRHVEPDALGTALEDLRSRVDAVYLHIDLDVLDPSVGRANRFAVEGGLSTDELAAIAERIADLFAIRAVAFTSYEPEGDPEGAIPTAAGRVLERLLAARAAA